MREHDAAELRGLLPLLLDLLAKVASGEVQPWDADADYRRLHSEVRAILTAYGEPCVCPWPTVWGWHGTAAADPDWQTTLARRASKARILCGLDEPPPWTFIDYYRRGDQDDVPFWADFAGNLEPHKQAILDDSLNRELAFLGPGVMSDWAKGHLMPCSDKPGSRTRVYMYKIREGAGQGEVVLRVFFMTTANYRLVLLHGYDKGADPDPARESREADEACGRRDDYLSR
jgi:hypothetical protein